MSRPVFALDIGTRTVIGIVGHRQEAGFYLDAVAVVEHESRSMLDGQIHHISRVAEVVKKVKLQLEEKTGLVLREVAVAAAGRALKTVKYIHHHDFEAGQEISKEDVICLEIEAVGLAQQQLATVGELGEGINSYHCVGYSVINYFLEKNFIGDLVGQYGKNIGVQVIATFLPRVVVDSLYTVLKKANLEMGNLTLEPIAASKVIIPQSMRQLNIALVDIGAGTSDIAISKEGAINSYAMVPIAGDEITEAFCHEYLLDFNEGERIKRLLAKHEQVILTNILGEQLFVSTKEVIGKLAGIVDHIAEKIAEQILVINERAPQAVFCIGGGSQFPTLPEAIAVKLGLPPQRAAVKGWEIVIGLQGDKSSLIGPEAITPLGIALTAEELQGLMKAEVNGRIISFINTSRPTVADALLAANINLTKMYGRPGLSLTVEVNKVLKIIKGSLGTRPVIKLNNKEVVMEQELYDFCKISVEPGKPGNDARAVVKDVIKELPQKTLIINGEKVELSPQVYVNGKVGALIQSLSDNAKIYFNKMENVLDILNLLEYEPENFVFKKVNYIINGKNAVYYYQKFNVLLNSNKVSLDEQVKDLDSLEIIENKNCFKRIKELISGDDHAAIKLTVNNKQMSIGSQLQRIQKNGLEANADDLVTEGDIITYEKLPAKLILADLLNYLNFNTLPEKKSARLVMLINQHPAQFTSIINDGDDILLEWK
jgi:cell division protein FtsA